MHAVYNPPISEWAEGVNISEEPGKWGNGTYDGPIEGVVLTYGNPEAGNQWIFYKFGYTKYYHMMKTETP